MAKVQVVLQIEEEMDACARRVRAARQAKAGHSRTVALAEVWRDALESGWYVIAAEDPQRRPQT